MTDSIHGDKRWLALIVLCLGVLMIVLDTTIVNVARRGRIGGGGWWPGPGKRSIGVT